MSDMNADMPSEQAKTNQKYTEKDPHKSWLSPPAPVRRIFNQFPLVTCDASSLPQRSYNRYNQDTLYIFSTSESTESTNLSCNPACLKWQAYLLIKKIKFRVRASNNHASPSGALPFLLPRRSRQDSGPSPIISSKLPKWLTEQGIATEPLPVRLEVYAALIDHNIRNAWLYHLYLNKANFEAAARPLYINPLSSSSAVRFAVSRQLVTAAQDELLKCCNVIDAGSLHESASKAFRALSNLLGERPCFGGTIPNLFDASVFAYTHLLLSDRVLWADLTLQKTLLQHTNLVGHQKFMYNICMGN